MLIPFLSCLRKLQTNWQMQLAVAESTAKKKNAVRGRSRRKRLNMWILVSCPSHPPRGVGGRRRLTCRRRTCACSAARASAYAGSPWEPVHEALAAAAAATAQWEAEAAKVVAAARWPPPPHRALDPIGGASAREAALPAADGAGERRDAWLQRRGGLRAMLRTGGAGGDTH